MHATSAAPEAYLCIAGMLVVPFLLVSPTWVLYSPLQRQLSYKAYEDGYGAHWSGPASFDLSKVVFRWSLPESSGSDEGLASGISFALHPDFCDRLMPLFPENTEMDSSFFGARFLSCKELRDAIKRGFDTWAINHKKINFVDVTDSCRNITSTDMRACPYAELFIVPASATSDATFSSDNAVSTDARPVRRLANSESGKKSPRLTDAPAALLL